MIQMASYVWFPLVKNPGVIVSDRPFDSIITIDFIE